MGFIKRFCLGTFRDPKRISEIRVIRGVFIIGTDNPGYSHTAIDFPPARR
jgi:hypothetical protein